MASIINHAISPFLLIFIDVSDTTETVIRPFSPVAVVAASVLLVDMRFMLFIFLTSLVTTCVGTYYEQMAVMLLRPRGLAFLGRKIEFGLRDGILDLQRKVQVLKVSSAEVKFDWLRKCSEQVADELQAIDVQTGSSMEFNAKDGIPLVGYNFAIFVEVDGKACNHEKKLLASARPCGVVSDKRPLLGILNVCTGSHWDGFKASKDLFRHEILHALGFGTLLPTDNIKKGPSTERYVWNDLGGSQKATRHFLDFSSKALNVVRRHFNCSRIIGVEADDKSLIHLNEYIFGNELMTPKLANGENLMTEISASILEETYLGDEQWYKVDRSALIEENEKYWFGKNWGCLFVKDSCFDYLKYGNVDFPFCNPNSYDVWYCITDNGKTVRRHSKCSSVALDIMRKAENGIVPRPVLNTRTTGSEPIYRFCPMNMDFINDRIIVPSGGQVRNCK